MREETKVLLFGGALGGVAVACMLLMLVMAAGSCEPPVNYVRTVDGRCLRITGGGWYRVYQREVPATECERRTR